MSLAELKKIIQDKYLIIRDVGCEFTLSSGQKSRLYFNIKGLFGNLHDTQVLCESVWWSFRTNPIPVPHFASFGGTELGGAIFVTHLMHSHPRNFEACFIRKSSTPRIHGLKKMIEGAPRSPILLVDDVLSTGHSVKEAVRTCHKEGYEVAGLLCVIDRTYVEDYAGNRYYDAPPGLWFYDIKPIGNEKNHLGGLDLPVHALFKEREDDPLGSYNPNSFNLFKENDDT